MKTLRKFFTNNRMILLSAIFPGIILLVMFAKIGIFPFGDLTILISDMNSQYVDFMSEYQRILHGNGSLLYSWHAGLGLNFLGLFAYYLSSPFNLLLFFFPEKYLLDAITLITLLKIAGCGLTFSIFLKQRFKTEPAGLLLPIFGTFYALMGYTVTYSFNIMWLDGVLLLPLLCLMIDRLFQDRGWIGCAVIFTMLFISNYYIGYMIGIFSVLYFLAGLANYQEHFLLRATLNKITQFLLSVILAAGISAFILFPGFFVLRDGMGLIGQTAPALTSQFPIADLLKKLMIGTFDGLRGNLPNIFCGLFTLCCLPLYFSGNSIKPRKKLTTLLLIILLIISFNLAPLDFFWHAFDYPSWFPYRYSFLLSFVLLTVAFEGLSKFGVVQPKNVLSGILVLGGILILFQKIDPETFSSRLLYVNFAFLMIYGILFAAGSINHSAGKWLLLILCIAECWLNADTVFSKYREDYIRRSDFIEFRDTYRKAISKLPAEEGTFYRIEKTVVRTYNDPLGLGYAGIGHFSSTASTGQSSFLKKIGLDCYATWCTYSGGTVFSDALLGIRYILSEDPPNAAYPQVSEGIWENPYAFPLAFFANQKILNVDLSSTDDPIRLQEELLAGLDSAEDAFFNPVPVKKTAMENMAEIEHESTDPVYSRIDPLQAGSADYEAVITKDLPHVLFIPNVSLNYNVWVNGEQVFDQNRNYTPYLVNLGIVHRGDKISIHVDTGEDNTYFENIQIYAFNLEAFARTVQNLRAAAPNVERTGNTRFLISFGKEDTGRLLLTSIPYDRGWTAKLDGTEIPVLPVMDGLVGLNIPDGSKQVMLEFVPRGWTVGIIITVISLGLLILAGVFNRKQHRKL
ncbi:MAG: YfhO family protein [Flexilinea sp.]